MADVRPFRALRPRDDLASEVIAPPYDVLTADEARALAEQDHSFVRVTRPEATMGGEVDPHSDDAYAKARDNLAALIEAGALVRDEEPTYYFYGQTMGDHVQVGVIGAASVDEYDAGGIKKHEHTRPDKEDDRTHHMEVIDAQVGLVFLAYRSTLPLKRLIARATKADPAWRVTTDDDVEHALWPAPASMVDSIREAFDKVDALYVADGHHRCAAASRVHAARGSEATRYFLAGMFPDSALQVLAYNRVVDDLNGRDAAGFLADVEMFFEVTAWADPVPSDPGTYSMYLDGEWYALAPRPGLFDPNDPVASLDASVLQDHLLKPLLGIDDPRTSDRIRFVGGIRGSQALIDAVDGGAAVAFHLFPTPLDQLFAVADAGLVMPPKSTWFEPKLREGVAIRPLS